MPRRANQFRRPLVVPDELKSGRAVVAAGLLLVTVQVGYRAWALYPSWFFTDDFRLLYDARHSDLTFSYLTRPFDSQLMPVGRLVAWVVAREGLNWPLAATVTLTFQLLASVACLWMLSILFGQRWAILAPLSVYLSTAITVPAFMWWAASLNQLPLQSIMFVTVSLAVAYLRSKRLATLSLVIGALAVGLAAYVKALLLLPLLAFVAVAYFSEGSLSQRARRVAVKYWPAVVGTLGLGVAYSMYYVLTVPQPFEDSGSIPANLADSMLGTAFSTGVFGGPWQWWNSNPPLVLARPPSWTVHLAWTLAVLVVLYGFLRRHRTLRAWALLGGYLITLLVLLMTTRGVLYGKIAGLDYRYLTDIAPVVTLVLGLVFLPLVGSTECSEPRKYPLLTFAISDRVIALLLVGIALAGLWSSTSYVLFWHHDNPGAAYLQQTMADMSRSKGVVHLAEQVLPPSVMPDYTKPYNRTSRMVTLLPGRVTFPRTTSRLAVVGDDGGLYRAAIKKGIGAKPGPVPNCGWKADPDGAAIPLENRTFKWAWWIRIGYLSSQGSPVTVSVGDTIVDASVLPGVNSLYIRAAGRFDEVLISGLRPGTIMCVDAVDVGAPVAGAPL